jgi:hypothetical protein
MGWFGSRVVATGGIVSGSYPNPAAFPDMENDGLLLRGDGKGN